MRAPIHTSCHAILASGRNLNIMAKSNVITASERTEFRIWASISIPGAMPPNHCPTKAIAAVRRRETRSRKPTTRIKPKERIRSWIMPRIPRPGFGCTPQIALSEVCNCSENARRTKKQRHNPDKGRNNPGRWLLIRVLNHILHRFPACVTQEAPQLVEDLTPRGLLPKNQPCDGNGYYQQRSERENGVIGQCGAQGRRLIFHPI